MAGGRAARERSQALETRTTRGRNSPWRPLIRRSRDISPFLLAAHIIANLAFAAGWFWGGRTERFAVGVLICDYALSGIIDGHTNAQLIWAASGSVITLIFLWLAFRSDRWWPSATAAALALRAMVALLELVGPGLSRYAAASAQLGLWLVVYATLLAGVGERWLAGERPVSDMAVWRPRRHS